MNAEQARKAVEDPQTSPELLYEIATSNPELRTQIEAHPNAYPELLEWLAGHEEPAPQDREEDPVSSSDEAAPQAGQEHSSEPTADGLAAWQPATTGPQRVVYVRAKPQREHRGAKMAIVALLTVFALSLVGVTAYTFLNFGSSPKRISQADPAANAQSAGSLDVDQSGDAKTGKESKKDETKKQSKKTSTVKYPAPKGAEKAKYMVDPNGNVACTVREGVLYCSVYEEYFSDYGYETCGSWPATLRLGKSGASLACDKTPVGGWGSGANMPFGTSAKSGKFACTSYEAGMSCWNTSTGKSLVLSWRGWEGGTDGRVKESKFPW